jgi:hypothetical protein
LLLSSSSSSWPWKENYNELSCFECSSD